ncbi:phenazine biosynthesis protein PhzF [Fervidicella metallireducens AeB]|uniref:Phenazine biosynthesis protein PhzF n=1 Tax=Fervidicella metallireducens AeB TaxID=1403537 RepID=A0A017RV08_9CLOT|nr:PhzF family phenazine biosynthesis protein [Fervidicella metallireducens]EYE88573.1 phenazine biosynthesis protein PhzF [Fervidicella metallireducens AeB]
MKIVVYTVNAFAKTKFGGNPAGVVLDAGNLSERIMQNIATNLGFSETAFIQRAENADFKLNFFTPNGEVDLCGHATIAAFSLMAEKKIIEKGVFKQETKAGILDIEVLKDGYILMDQTEPKFGEIIDKSEVADTLKVKEDIFIPNLPLQVVSTGLRDIFVPIRSMRDLNEIKPDFKKIAYISKKYNVTGYHLFTLETELNSTAHCRNFAPLYDIPEESATGTSNGALSCYLYKYGLIDKENAGNLIFEQGYSMNKPSEIMVSLNFENDEIKNVKVGGRALVIDKRELNLL